MATCDPKTLLASVSAFRGASERQIRLARIGSLCNVVFPPIAAPTAPSNLTATPNNTVPNVALGWTQGAGTITSVNLYRQVNGGGFSLYQTLGVVTAYTDTGVAYGNTYDYKVLDHGPGGDSAFSNSATAVVAIDPTTFATPIGWWKADSFALADGTAVGGVGKEWVDQMGDINHYGRFATVALQPIFKTNIANGKPGILFTWAGDFSDQHALDISNGNVANNINPAGDYTVVAVLKPSSLSARVGGAFIGNQYTGNCSLYFQAPTPTSLIAFDGVNNQGSVSIADQTDVLSMTAFVRSGGNLTSIRYNKTAILNGAPGPTGLGHFGQFGAVAAPVPQARWGGYIFEVSIYASALTTVQLDSLYDNYFKPKYSLP